MNKLLNYLGLAKRAGKLVQGTDAVLKNLRSRQTHIMFVASDASDATKEKVNKKGLFYNIPVIENYSTDELSKALGEQNIKVIAINDLGFKKAIMKEFKEVTNNESQRISWNSKNINPRIT